jgi:transposase-like protein
MPGGRGAGRPEWRPSPECRDQVARLACEGVTHTEIARAVGVSAPTLRLRCKAELLRGRCARSLGPGDGSDV